MNLYDILACPKCKVRIYRQNEFLVCDLCGQRYPIVNNIPVVFPDGRVPEIQHEADLPTRSSYDPWIHRIILQSLFDNQIVVNLGSGNMVLDDPCIIRMDVTLSPYVDLVADAHAPPFLPESIDYIFSLAVFEHLSNPFLAAQAMYGVLKDGGYIYHECNFVFAYHGYPHHYFNATLQGLEQVFSNYIPLRKGVATYQMPSFALDMVLRSYLKYSHAKEYLHGKRLVELVQKILDLDLKQFDIYFSETGALNIAAGTYFSGMKQTTPHSTLIPTVIRERWKNDSKLREQFANMNDLTTTNNIMLWALRKGREQYPEIDKYLRTLEPFHKRGETAPWNREHIRSLPLVEARFGAIGFSPDESMSVNAKIALERVQTRTALNNSRHTLFQKAIQILQHEGIKAFATKALKYGSRMISRR